MADLLAQLAISENTTLPACRQHADIENEERYYITQTEMNSVQ